VPVERLMGRERADFLRGAGRDGEKERRREEAKGDSKRGHADKRTGSPGYRNPEKRRHCVRDRYPHTHRGGDQEEYLKSSSVLTRCLDKTKRHHYDLPIGFLADPP